MMNWTKLFSITVYIFQNIVTDVSYIYYIFKLLLFQCEIIFECLRQNKYILNRFRVHELSCKYFNNVDIVQTEKSFETMFKEHRAAFKQNKNTSYCANHFFLYHHSCIGRITRCNLKTKGKKLDKPAYIHPRFSKWHPYQNQI